ncbi:heteromeric transposase endonuclease subunit TnsA, partial [Vibrio anguillarum]|nr:heteromeric transposase endonuclease subunit TnsA [Vibrio anguillarum]
DLTRPIVLSGMIEIDQVKMDGKSQQYAS